MSDYDYDPDFANEFDEELEGAALKTGEFTMWERLTGPVTSFVFHVIMIIMLAIFVTGHVLEDEKDQAQQFETPPEQEEEKLEEPPEEMEVEEITDNMSDSDFSTDFQTDVPIVNIAQETTTSEPTDVDIEQISLVADAPSPIIMKGLFANRSGAGRLAALNAFGGGGGSENAVIRALNWLKRNQIKDGGKAGTWESKAPTAMAGFGLLAFLAHGETPNSKEYGETVKLCIDYLLRTQNDNGSWSGGDGHEYTHAIAAYAVSEGYAMTKHPSLRYAMDKAIGRIVDGQILQKFPADGSMKPVPGLDVSQGGTVHGAFWNYKYEAGAYPNGFDKDYMNSGERMRPRLSTTARKDNSYAGFQIQALKAAKFAGYDNPLLDQTLKAGVNGLKFMQTKKKHYFSYSSTNNSPHSGSDSLNQLGVGAYCMYLAEHNATEEARNAAEALYAAGFDPQAKRTFYRVYYQANANFWVDGTKNGANWTQYNGAMKPWLIQNQDRSGKPELDGSWTHTSIGQEDTYGRVYSTALGALSLMVYYRNLPGSQVTMDAGAQAVVPMGGEADLEVEMEVEGGMDGGEGGGGSFDFDQFE